MKLPFKNQTTGEKFEINLPSGWHEVTLGQWVKCEKLAKDNPDDLIEWVSLFSGIPVQDILNWPVGVMPALTGAINFINDDIDLDSLVKSHPPIQFKVNGRTYNSSIDFSKFNVGQLWKYENLCKNGKIPTDKISACIATCLVQGEWEDAKFDALEAGVNELPFLDAIALHGFFLNRFLIFYERQKPEIKSQNLTKLQRVLRKSQNASGGFSRFITSLMGTRRKKSTTLI
jgi:hypothetical protein